MSAYDHLEPLAAEKAKEQGLPHIEAYLLSIAVSQKRIADSVALMPALTASLQGTENLLREVVDSGNQYDQQYGVPKAAIRTKSG